AHGRLQRTVRLAVDHEAAGAADALTAVVIERDRLLAAGHEALVDDVEHLEEARVLGNALRLVGDEAALVLRAGLPPDVQCKIHGMRSACMRIVRLTCSCAVRAQRTRR